MRKRRMASPPATAPSPVRIQDKKVRSFAILFLSAAITVRCSASCSCFSASVLMRLSLQEVLPDAIHAYPRKYGKR